MYTSPGLPGLFLLWLIYGMKGFLFLLYYQ
jgi:hypothetical protein